MYKKLLPFFGLLLFSISSIAQETFPSNGVSDSREGRHAFTNATIHIAPGSVMQNATLIIKDGKIESVGTTASLAKGIIVHDMKGKHIYPSFVDLYTNYGMPKPQAEGNRQQQQPQMLSNKKGAYSWNEALKTEFSADAAFKHDPKSVVEWRKHGFGAVLSHRMDGISRGSSTFVQLGDDKEHGLILKNKVAHHLSFRKGTSTQNYPSSLMGCISLLRQTYLDAKWYTSQRDKKEVNLSLSAWNEAKQLPQVFDVGNRLEILRADKIGKEFGVNYIFKGSGDEYMRIQEIKRTGSALIIPVDFPVAYDVSDPFDAKQVSLSDMKHWELAPSNPAALAKANIPFALTSQGLKNKGDFLNNIKKAIKHGLTEAQALGAITINAAKILGLDAMIGTLEQGKVANFIVTDKPVFEDGMTIHQNWVGGQGFTLKAFPSPTPLGEGRYDFQVGDKKYVLDVLVEKDVPSMNIIVNDTTKIKVNHSYKNDILGLSFKEEGKMVRLSGVGTATMAGGQGTNTLGDWVDWSIGATRALPAKPEQKAEQKAEQKPESKMEMGEVTYPFLPYGWTERPTAKTVLFKNATVWTNEKEGVLEQADVLIANGKIKQVGKNLSTKADITIDATGKHLTSGIIDEHSHIAISRGVNEGTQYSTAEVSIADVINSEDVNIYRNLSGGVVAAQLLHGSANPIGGQSGIVKFRWGFSPEEMKIKNAAPFIKFALGENVKQSNWGDNNRSRFPQTRMGVEQVFDDHFVRAREYGALKRSGKPYRKDLEMETLLEILEKKRFISCHSYVQSEINMLMKVAEKHNFTLNTFTHILEGYKVADKMKAHNAGASTFSDWWAYKYEVIDAIPYNAAILHKMGVLTAINSDDAEMSRRLNQEAAKTIKYGGVSEEDAWKMVTLNPAKLLHLDDNMGSIKVGKDADIVLWSDNPLSMYAKAEQTYVDGMKFFDIEEDAKHRASIKKERARLMQKMISDKKGGAKTRKPAMKYHHHYHCDHYDDEMK